MDTGRGIWLPFAFHTVSGVVGDSYDNTLAESVIGLYKTELIHKRAPWKDRDQVEYATSNTSTGSTTGGFLEPIGHIPPQKGG